MSSPTSSAPSTTPTPPGPTDPTDPPPPPPDPTDSSSSSSTTTTSSSTTTTESSTTESSTPSSTPTSTSSSTAPPQSITTIQGGVVTQTSTLFVSSTRSVDPSAGAQDRGGTPFFENKSAVAGVFSVVGLIGLALIGVIILNYHRRRKAKAFDRELQEATREAAAAPKPVFLDDEEDDYGPNGRGGQGGYGAGGYGQGGYGAGYGAAGYGAQGGYGGQGQGGYDDKYDAYGGSGGGSGGGGYSDVSSHGTYQQPSMSVTSHGGGESYGMRDLHHSPQGQVGEVFDPYAVGAAGVGGAAGAAGIGVARARSMSGPSPSADPHSQHQQHQQHQQHPHNPLADGGAPYAAFALPHGGADPYATNANLAGVGGVGAFPVPPQTNRELLEAAGVVTPASAVGPSLARGPSQHHSSGYGGHLGHQHQRSMDSESYASHYVANAGVYGSNPALAGGGHGSYQSGSGYQSQNQSSGYAGQQGQGGQNQNRYSVVTEDDEDAYGGYDDGFVVSGEPISIQQAKRQTINPAVATSIPISMSPSTISPSSVPSPVVGGSSSSGPSNSVSPAAGAPGSLPNPFDRDRDRDSVSSYSGEEPKRVLKIANE